jgi:hypothetical protein
VTLNRRLARIAGLALLLLGLAGAAYAEEPGLLFRASGDKGLNAEVAGGDPVPNFADKVHIIPNGRIGGAISTDDDVVLTWKAPGNIYAQRGTLSFFWRSRYPVGVAPFPIFRVGYADHTSWDMVWLRIDWNGDGYDAFVTDDNLARVRVSFKVPNKPAPDRWTHLAVTWDETQGIALYVDGKLAAKKDSVGVWDTGLDQFGPTIRVVSPHQVQSRYNFLRGGDYDEFRIYDHALPATAIASLAKAEEPAGPPAPVRDLANQSVRDEWWLRYGWNRPGDVPTLLATPSTRIRKVEFTDAKDIKEWMWKATDGIAETTWPGVYNRSRLPGRNDYFPLPDWNVYVEGGKALTLTLPKEPWNHLEIQGAACGDLTWGPGATSDTKIASRAKDQERTFNQFAEARTGGTLTFTNIAQETPIQEIAAYDLGPGAEPKGTTRLTYTVHVNAAADSPDLDALNAFIAGRYPPEERSTVVALPDGAPSRTRPADKGPRLPLVHILIPYEIGASPHAEPLYRSFGYGWENMHDALDGIAIDLPALKVKPTHGEAFPLNIQVKDPIWPMRNLMDISVSVKPGEARTLWLDTRDRILPNKSFYITIAGAGADFDAKALDGMKIRLVFKDRQAGLKEHVTDRFNQIKDNWGYLVEEHTASKRESLYDRLVTDATDLLKVDPDNRLAREYWADITYNSQGPLPFTQPTPPPGAPPNEPLWAFRQLEDLKLVHRFVDWWIDNRQVPFGDLGGGISDDTDLLEQWPGLALMGVEPDKIRRSHTALADAAYKDHMFTNGLATIATDELHSYEDGINSNSEAMYIGWGDPKVVERLMTTTAALNRIIQPNAAGHLHFKTSWFSGSIVYSEGPWEWQKDQSVLVMHPSLLMADFNADPTARKYVLGVADGLLAHAKPDGSVPDEINWRTEATKGSLPTNTPAMQLLWGAYRLSGNPKYAGPLIAAANKTGPRALTEFNENMLDALNKRGDWSADAIKRGASANASNYDRYLAWQASGDKRFLEDLYADEIRVANQHMYMHTEGHWWIDRVEIPSEELQRTRLGGIALKRNWIWPGNTVSWRFDRDEAAEQVAILMPGATPTHFKVIAFNTAERPVKAAMTGWDVTAGDWTMTSGTSASGADKADAVATRTVPLEKSSSVEVTFAPRTTTVLEFTLAKAGPATERRPDLGIGPDDVKRTGRQLQVTVHSLGALDAPAGSVMVEDASGKVVVRAGTPALKAPVDLKPKTAVVKLALPEGFNAKGAKVRVALPEGVREITQLNNAVALP